MENSTRAEKFTKSVVSNDEERKQLELCAHLYDLYNPNFKIEFKSWEERLQKAKNEGYTSEICNGKGCGRVHLAFQHFTDCRDDRCPFSTGKSLLDMLEEQIGDKL